jgi:hypothetical protein
LNQKLKLRNLNNRYALTYSRNGANSDPYEIYFLWRNVKHRMKSNYNGNSKQVGNHITQTLQNGVWITISYKYVDNLDTIDFLLMSEIARRKCYDPQLNQYDEFYQLPTAYCIVMGRILINKGYLAANGFLSNPNLTVFSTKDRVKNAKKLLQIFLDKNILSLGELNVIVDDFYQI